MTPEFCPSQKIRRKITRKCSACRTSNAATRSKSKHTTVNDTFKHRAQTCGMHCTKKLAIQNANVPKCDSSPMTSDRNSAKRSRNAAPPTKKGKGQDVTKPLYACVTSMKTPPTLFPARNVFAPHPQFHCMNMLHETQKTRPRRPHIYKKLCLPREKRPLFSAEANFVQTIHRHGISSPHPTLPNTFPIHTREPFAKFG